MPSVREICIRLCVFSSHVPSAVRSGNRTTPFHLRGPEDKDAAIKPRSSRTFTTSRISRGLARSFTEDRLVRDVLRCADELEVEDRGGEGVGIGTQGWKMTMSISEDVEAPRRLGQTIYLEKDDIEPIK